VVLSIISALSLGVAAGAAEKRVSSDAELKAAVGGLEPGDILLIAPGEYTGPLRLENVAGTAEAPIVIKGEDPARPPVIRGGGQCIGASDAAYVVIADLKVIGARYNGINFDDGGTYDTPAHHIRFENIEVRDIGSGGNHDGIKLNCRIFNWGGSAIDMVGCHNGLIEKCHFEGLESIPPENGVQTKGGSSGIRILANFFKNAGWRGVNIGGHTDLEYFRPRGVLYEAADIEVAGNRFVGCDTAFAFASADGGHVHHNTIYMPVRWPFRILQDHSGKGFTPCRDGVVEYNIFVFSTSPRTPIGIGEGTAPDTFTLKNNLWFDPEGEVGPVPVAESGGLHNIDPELEHPGTPRMRAASNDPRLSDLGARAYEGD
jgi:hypothetical protein